MQSGWTSFQSLFSPGREDRFPSRTDSSCAPDPIQGTYPLPMVGVNSHCVTVDIGWDRGGGVGWGNAGYDGIQLAAIIGNDEIEFKNRTAGSSGWRGGIDFCLAGAVFVHRIGTGLVGVESVRIRGSGNRNAIR